MKIIAVSDLHGELPALPEADLAIFAGDICPWYDHELEFQRDWLMCEWRIYLQHEVPAKHIVWIGGNHDFALDDWYLELDFGENIHYLQQSRVYIEDYCVWGSPYSFSPPGWAFNLDGSESKAELLYDDMAVDTDILVTHGPPIAYGGTLPHGDAAGSLALWNAVKRVRPKLHVFGHVHSNHGRWQYPPLAELPEGELPITLANVSFITEEGHPINGASEFWLPDRVKS